MTTAVQGNRRHCLQFITHHGKLVAYSVIGIFFILMALVPIIVDIVPLFAKHVARISAGTVVFKALNEKNMRGAYLQAYVFNMTNAEEFRAGQDSKLKLQEVGPFVYQEYRTNDKFFLDEEKGTMRYDPKMYTQFLPEMSVADPKNVTLTMPNIAMLAITSMVSSTPFFTRMGYNIMVDRLRSSPIMSIDAHSLLWGYDEPLIAMAHKLLPGWITFGKMGVLDRLYDSGNFSFDLGATNKDKFLIKSFNGLGGITALGYEGKRSRCNTFVDTYEGIMYPSDLTKDQPLRVFRNGFCRILDLEYTGTTTMDFGTEVFKYRFHKEMFSHTPTNDCLCSRDYCIDGLTDLSACFYGLGFGLSNAHFLNGDPKLYENMEGVSPNEEDHGSEFLVDPMLGAVLSTRFTLQLNLVLEDVSFNAASKHFANLIIPVAYFKIIQPELPDDKQFEFWIIAVLAPKVLIALEVISFLIGLFLCVHVVQKYISALGNENTTASIEAQKEPLMDVLNNLDKARLCLENGPRIENS